MASLSEIQTAYRHTDRPYQPFGTVAQVGGYVPNLTRRRNYYLRSIAAGALDAVAESADVEVCADGIWGDQEITPDMFHDPERCWLWQVAPAWAIEDDAIAILAFRVSEPAEVSVIKTLTVYVVTWRENLKPEYGHFLAPAIEETPHECDGDTCPACHPGLRDENRPHTGSGRGSRKPAEKKIGGVRKNKQYPQRIFDGRTGEWRWI